MMLKIIFTLGLALCVLCALVAARAACPGMLPPFEKPCDNNCGTKFYVRFTRR